MIPFLNNRVANILLVGSSGVSLFVWQKRRLLLHARYASSDAGLAAFDSALPELVAAPFTIVVDVIEEDFRTETFAHVTGSDRSALLTRKLNHLFRTTTYKTAKVVGREKTGRKDDKVFLTALTKPEILDPWLNRILARRLPVRAITSSAYLMERLARYLSLNTQEHVLIVNDEEVVGVRQTYLRKGRVVFSRLTPASVPRTGTFEEFIDEQSTQTRKYLERIKQLPYDAALNVYVFTSLPQAQEGELEKDLLTFHFSSIADLGSNFAISDDGEPAGAIAYSLAKAFKQGVLPNVYGPFTALRYFFIGKLRAGFYLASGLVLLFTLGFLYPGIVDIRDRILAEQRMILQTVPVRREYETLRARFPETPIPSGKMEVVVETYDLIASQMINLNDTLEFIGSTALVSSELRLVQIDWNLEEVPDANLDLMFTGLEADKPEVVFQKAIAAGRTAPVITLQGVVTSSGSRREARERVVSFVDAIAQKSGLMVTPLIMPLDLNSASSITATLDGNPLSEEFVLEIRPKVPTP